MNNKMSKADKDKLKKADKKKDKKGKSKLESIKESNKEDGDGKKLSMKDALAKKFKGLAKKEDTK